MSLPPTLTDALSKSITAARAALNILKTQNTYGDATLLANSESSPPLSALRTDFVSIQSLIYVHTTTLSLALKPPSTPAGALRPLADLTSDVSKLTGCVQYIAAGSHGATFHKEATWRAQDVLESLLALFLSFCEETEGQETVVLKLPNGPEDKAYLMRTGAVHSAAEYAKTTFSQDNRAAVIKSWKVNQDAIADASVECEEISDDEEDGEEGNFGDEDDFDDGWEELMGDVGKPAVKPTPSERETIKKALSLLRLTSALHSRILSRHLTSLALKDTTLDLLLAQSNQLSSIVDDLVSSLHPPHNSAFVNEKLDVLHTAAPLLVATLDGRTSSGTNAEDLAKTMETLQLATTEADGGDKEKKWLKMCLLQIDKAIEAMR